MDGDIPKVLADMSPVLVVIVSALLPLILAVINGCNWKPQVKSLVAFGATCAVGAGAAWFDDNWSRAGVLTYIASVYGLSQILRARLYEPTGLTPAIEENVLRDGIVPGGGP